MAIAPTSVEIREYQVGFGDCFLLSFVYGEDDRRHVLIDFGTTELPGRGRPRTPAKASEHMPKVASDIEKVCGGRLTAVVATHRHADHISGFGTDARTGRSGEVIKSLRPRVVLQPWTEDPAAAKNARAATRDSGRSVKGFVTGLAAMQDVAGVIYELASSRPTWMTGSLQKELAFIGLDNIPNESAVKNLIAMGEPSGATAVWAHHGSSSHLERHLPGVEVRVLGPPNLHQTEKLRTMRETDPDEFWHLLTGPKFLRGEAPLAGGLNPRRYAPPVRVPADARWFRERLDRLRGEQLLQVVRALDDQLNNTSLILLFEVLGKRLLFPGDAQIENWSYALKDADDAAQTRRILADVDVYKVGHHGSLNATPKKLLWETFTKRNKHGKERLHTLLSTLPGKHGNVRNKTEVPRRPLLEALERESQLSNTNKLEFGRDPVLCHLVVIRP